MAADPDAFIAKWTAAGLHERATYTSFIRDLCAVIGVAAPHEASVDPGYTFDAPVRFKYADGASSQGFIDCYKKGAFVLEAKQSRKAERGESPEDQYELALQSGAAVPLRRPNARAVAGNETAFDRMMRNARNQAEGYAKALDEWPPFLVIVDVGRAIELYADFSRQGKNYAQFPDRRGFRIALEDLRDQKVRERLKAVWDDPLSLDPAAERAAVTNGIAALLAKATRSMENRGPPRTDRVAFAAHAGKVADFLMQCLFAMFAEDVGLLPEDSFQHLIEQHRGRAGLFHHAAAAFFADMDKGTPYSPSIQAAVRRFNGGLFHGKPVMEVTEDELGYLQLAAQRDWRNVEPAIFGTLLEQALDPKERASLGAHYTPRSYVERLVEPTVIEPLRADFDAVESTAIGAWLDGRHEEARAGVRAFHDKLCATRVLDPACGTGNFLYVSMELMKRLEGKVLDLLRDLGEPSEPLNTVGPGQFWGLEKNARAAPIAELVLWIGYLQWWFRTKERSPADPVLEDFGTIRVQDALLAFDREELLRGEDGRPVTRQDPDAVKLHPITGEEVPDPDARLEQFRYVNPRGAPWPEAEFIVGNPPLIGAKHQREKLGDGYAEALWASRRNRFKSADLVMYWWDRAAELLTAKGTKLRRFGFVTTNSLTQKFSRRVLEAHLGAARPVRLAFAIPDHPWVKGAGRAAVRIAMTVAEAGASKGTERLMEVSAERDLASDAPIVELREARGTITPDLTVGPDVTRAMPLLANEGLCSPGVKLHGSGFIVTSAEAAALGLGREVGLERIIKPYRNGRDLTDRARGVLVIDLFGMTETEVRRAHAGVYDRILTRVRPERDVNNRAAHRESWWLFGEARSEIRPALGGLHKYLVSPITSKHRFFQFIDGEVLPDDALAAIASDSAVVLGVLTSAAYGAWFRANGSTLEDRPRFIKRTSSTPSPSPTPRPSSAPSSASSRRSWTRCARR